MGKRINKNTNEYAIRRLWSRRQLAEALVQWHQEETTDYDWDENPIPGYMEDYYTTSDNQEFSDYEEAVEHELWWLAQEVSSSGE